MSVLPAPDPTVAAELQRLESARYVAMTERDFDTLTRLFDDRLTYIHSSGVRDTKQEYLQAVRDSVYVYGPIEHSQLEIHALGDTAVVHGEMRADITVNGTPKYLRNIATSVWIRSGVEWLLLSYQTTPLPQN